MSDSLQGRMKLSDSYIKKVRLFTYWAKASRTLTKPRESCG